VSRISGAGRWIIASKEARVLDWLKRTLSPRRAASRLQPESGYVVTIDETGVRCQRPSGDMESVTWDDLDAVLVETNDTGPWGADVVWLLLGSNGSSGCVIPQGATGEQALLARLQSLPGFDNEQLIAAMSCTENQKFLCWRRPAAS
jgi:hypothetical protein